jgi:UrcA family protein
MKLANSLSLFAFALGAVALVNAQVIQEVVVQGSKAPAGLEVRSKSVKFADLDLSKSAGIETLLARIRRAAGDVCSPEPQVNDIGVRKEYDKCVNGAVDGAVAKVNNPRLSALASKGTR